MKPFFVHFRALDPFARRTLLIAALAVGAGLALRFGFVQPHAIGILCEGATPPVWCALRRAAVLSFNTGGLGFAAFAAALAAHVFDRRGLAALALIIAGLAASLYNAEWASAAAVLALLRLARA